jgi:membrane protein required for colicin V production
MQDISIFDIVVIAVTLLLGLKGLFRGFIKEVFGLIGIIGGIFVASRLATTVGEMIAPVLALKNESSIQLMGFIVGLIGFWLLAYITGLLLSKVFSLSGLGIIDKLFGFIFVAFKVFLIFSIIIYAISQIETIKQKIDESIGNTITYPILVAGGSYIIKLDKQVASNTIQKTVNEAVDKGQKSLTEMAEKKGEEQLNEMMNSGKQIINENINQQEEPKAPVAPTSKEQQN